MKPHQDPMGAPAHGEQRTSSRNPTQRAERVTAPQAGLDETALLPASVSTPRLLLRCWEPADVPAVARAIAASIEHLRPWLAWTSNEPLPEDDRRALFKGWNHDRLQGGSAHYGIFLNGHVVGAIGLRRRGQPQEVEIGYWLHVDHTGNGYAREAAAAVTAMAVQRADVKTVIIRHDPDNLASRRIPEQLGFTPLDTQPTTDDDEADQFWYTTRETWRPPEAAERPPRRTS